MKKPVSTLNKTVLLSFIISASSFDQVQAFSYNFAESQNNPDIVTHAGNYDGTGGIVDISVGIDMTSAFANEMVISVRNAINTYNNLAVTTGNLDFTSLTSGAIDFESVLLHELGHSLGLSHPNVGGGGVNSDYTAAGVGINGVDDFNSGADGIIGSSDDLRGDDVNFNFFKIEDNDPFSIASVVDGSTYTTNLNSLPGSDTFSANGNRNVAAALGYADTESVLKQGTFANEVQRTLAADDVAGILFANAGLDRITGTADDYSLNLTFAGLTGDADILIDFDNARTGFAVSSSGATFLSTNDLAITSNDIFFNDGIDWFFNDVSSVPEPGSSVLLGLGGFASLLRRNRRKNR